jgi:CheY-like chemotaxis protein
MEAIGTLAGGIAHDFNNLLMGTQGNISLMLLDIDSSHPHYERLKNIEKQVQSGSKLTSLLLGYARKGKYEVKPVDLNELVEETSDTFGRTRREITIHQELAEDLFAIEADQTQIEQVLLNLFVNAGDAMSGGGDLILKTMNTTHDEMKGKLYDPKPGDYVLLTVTDTGIGMDKETMERIFDPFFTTKEMGRGTGLGLASAYGIIKGHGGYIEVDSKEGQGATFSIYLPASGKKVPKPVKTSDQLIKGTGTVLLVDDEEVILEVGKELLEGMGYQVLTAKDGKEAIEVYKKNLDEIDIVLLDMVMPNMGGGDAYDRMKEINPDIKALLSSGFSIDGEASEILERGCNGFIQKPFTMKGLSGKIMEILEKK